MKISSRLTTDGKERWAGLLVSVLLMTGCTTTKTTTTARTATEQLLLSTATDHALRKTGLEPLAGKSVFLDASYFDSYDSKYVLGTILDAISRSGAILASGATNGEVVVQARSGALAINQSETMFGIPSIGIPVPLSGTVQTPEIAFYKSERQRAYAKLALLAVARQSGAHVYSSGSLDGQSFEKHIRCLFISWTRTDIPEKAKTEAGEKHLETWAPRSLIGKMYRPPTGGEEWRVTGWPGARFSDRWRSMSQELETIQHPTSNIQYGNKRMGYQEAL
jgi:hypothetical protein